jgi:hypothetical protein
VQLFRRVVRPEVVPAGVFAVQPLFVPFCFLLIRWRPHGRWQE